MFHCNGWCYTWAITAVGATHICLRKFDPARVWQLIESEGVTHLSGSPNMFTVLLNHRTGPSLLNSRSSLALAAVSHHLVLSPGLRSSAFA